MSINADNIIGTYDIYSKQYILTFTEKPTLIESTDCSFQISIIPEFECSYSGLNVPDGIVGNTVTATATEGTIGTITPSTYQLGSTTYSVQITAPGGYTNAGNIILCTDTATGTPTFVCGDAGLSVNDGNVGATVTGTVTAGTIVSFSPSTYVSGSNNYTATITVPSGYSNTGSTIDCVDTATGTVPAYAQITGVTSATINNNISLTGEDVGFTGSTWAWTGGAAAGLTSKVITITETSAGNQTYGVTIDGTYSDTHTVTWNNPAPFTSISGPTTGTPNTNITLTASDNYYTAVSWVWTGGTINNSVVNPVTFTETSSGTVTYTATGTDSSNNTYQASHTVNWSTLPEYTCSDAGYDQPNGTQGASTSTSATFTDSNITTYTISPTTYSAGSDTYTATITVPSGYSNTGATIDCTSITDYNCNNAGYSQPDGNTGDGTAAAATFTDSNITGATVSPTTYSSGSATYTASFTVPSGYPNSGSTLNTCTDTATGSDVYTRNMLLVEGVTDDPTYQITWSDNSQTVSLVSTGSGATKIATQTLSNTSIAVSVSRTSPDAIADATTEITWTRNNSSSVLQETNQVTINSGNAVTSQGYTFTNVANGDTLFIDIQEN